MEPQWHILLADNEQRGPMTKEDIRALVAEGKATSRSNIWRAGMPSWQPIERVPEFADLAPAPSPDVLRDTLEKGKRGAVWAMNTAKIKLQIATLNRKRDKLLTALGQAVYTQRETLALDGPLKTCVEEIVACDEEIGELQATLSSKLM